MPIAAAMILCAGLGTRLRPLSSWLPKPLVPVGDRPAVGHVVAAVRAALPSVRLVANAHHRADDLLRWAEAEGVALSSEAELLGTAGGIAAARALLGDGDVVVWNGDIASELELASLVATHERTGAAATLAVRPLPRGEGNVGFDAGGRVVRLRTARFGDESRGGAFLGIHVIGAALREVLPEVGCLVGDVYLPALARGAYVAAHVTDAPFVDVGTLGQYAEANRAWLARRKLDAWAHPSASIAASIAGSVVGESARVLAPAERCVVWARAVVEAPVTDAVVTPFGTVRFD